MKKALFWDFDGTLAYGSNWSVSLYNSLKDYDYNVDLEKIKKHLSSRSDEQVKVIFPWHTPNISYTEYTGEKWWDLMFEKIEPFYNHYNPLHSLANYHLYYRNILYYHDII